MPCEWWHCITCDVSGCVLSSSTWTESELRMLILEDILCCPPVALCVVCPMERRSEPMNLDEDFISAWVVFPNHTVMPLVRMLAMSRPQWGADVWVQPDEVELLFVFFIIATAFLTPLRFSDMRRPRNLWLSARSTSVPLTTERGGSSWSPELVLWFYPCQEQGCYPLQRQWFCLSVSCMITHPHPWWDQG